MTAAVSANSILLQGLDKALSNVPGFLADWGPNHRDLDDDQRAQAGRYIAVIIAHKLNNHTLDIEDAEEFAIDAWRRFRTAYDSLIGPYSKGPKGDFPLAMRRI